MKTVKELKAEMDAAWDAHDKAMQAAIKREFPDGTRVSWMHGRNRQKGRVVRHCYSDSIMVQNERAGGGQKRVSACDLERLDMNNGEGKK